MFKEQMEHFFLYVSAMVRWELWRRTREAKMIQFNVPNIFYFERLSVIARIFWLIFKADDLQYLFYNGRFSRYRFTSCLDLMWWNNK